MKYPVPEGHPEFTGGKIALFRYLKKHIYNINNHKHSKQDRVNKFIISGNPIWLENIEVILG